MTTKEISDRTESTKSLFRPPMRTPSPTELREMFALALEILIKEAARGNMFTFNKKIYRQRKGGAIGSTLTGALACLFMLVWCRDLKERLRVATMNLPNSSLYKLYLLLYYVDDGTISTEALPPGCRLIGDRFEIVEDEVENDRQIPKDERTAKLLTELGNKISSFINLTCDYPSANENGFMPVLDVQARVQCRTIK